MSPKFHASIFGFPNQRTMRAFYEDFFPDRPTKSPQKYLRPKTAAELTDYHVFALALWRMRSGFPMQYIAAVAGAHRGRLGQATTEWCHLLGGLPCHGWVVWVMWVVWVGGVDRWVGGREGRKEGG